MPKYCVCFYSPQDKKDLCSQAIFTEKVALDQQGLTWLLFFTRDVWCLLLCRSKANARNVSYTNLTGKHMHTISSQVDQNSYSAYSPKQKKTQCFQIYSLPIYSEGRSSLPSVLSSKGHAYMVRKVTLNLMEKLDRSIKCQKKVKLVILRNRVFYFCKVVSF